MPDELMNEEQPMDLESMLSPDNPTISIDVAAPEYRGAPYPEFDKQSVNESKIRDEERAKAFRVEFHPVEKIGIVRWLTEECDFPSGEFNDEIKRAFIANGAEEGVVIDMMYGRRDEYTFGYQLVISDVDMATKKPKTTKKTK